jgi:hypothetical protein
MGRWDEIRIDSKSDLISYIKKVACLMSDVCLAE